MRLSADSYYILLSSLALLVEMHWELSKLQACCLHLLENKYLAFRDCSMSAKKSIFFPDVTKVIYQKKIFFFSRIGGAYSFSANVGKNCHVSFAL